MSKKILLTGAAGFIGFHTAAALKQRGNHVVGLDNFNSYYDPLLKRKRVALLKQMGIEVIEGDVTDAELLKQIFQKEEWTHVLHLAAQAGVRYARKHPQSYLKNNLEAFLCLLEQLKLSPHISLVYASSSSVYGTNEKVPFSVDDRTDCPANLYAATKKANELMAYSYHHMYGLRTTGLRYFTVYGPWGRPDMAYFLFTDAIMKEKPIVLFNHGKMWRDFTYIDDIVEGTLAALERVPQGVFNLGNHQSESLADFVSILEEALGKKAHVEFAECPPDEILTTYADISLSQEKLAFTPKVPLKEGLYKFVSWYKEFSLTNA
ncbi:MAG: NAD-dependent epimerase/dehydratase family protein [Verrucomicrobia bacterium]|nr:NAD-dependent epimerase/dehydratase family protein [Verrucomicrobiota bacterium]MBS0646397.1 NAD-dependent epimerase/dehydratase family protein [Verrucomicrobiota bacterium]